MGIDPSDVYITAHARAQFILRYPHEVLPKDPDLALKQILASARPASPYTLKKFTTLPNLVSRTRQVMLETRSWVLVLKPDRKKRRTWVLVTVLRRDRPRENQVTMLLRGERLSNHTTFRTGMAMRILQQLTRHMDVNGGIDPRQLACAWREYRYPDYRHGGYATFEDFLRDAARSGAISIEQKDGKLVVRAWQER